MWFKKRSDPVRTELEELRSRIDDAITGVNGQLTGFGEQLGKLSRLTYKNGKDSSDHLVRLADQLERQESEWKAAYERERNRREEEGQTLQSIALAMIAWLDDLDALSEGRDASSAGDSWDRLTQHWREQLLQQLNLLGLRELPVLGSMFDPATCEAAGTVAAAPDGSAAVPYQIVAVLKRGYQLADGRLVRKAQVITVKEEMG